MHFVDEGFDTKRIWESVEGYIGSAYDLEALETIYLHADGGSWIGAFSISENPFLMSQAERRSCFIKPQCFTMRYGTKNRN